MEIQDKQQTKIVKGLPPNIRDIQRLWGDIPEDFIFTYGNTIYSPLTDQLPPDIIEHEEVHTKQQGDNPDFYISRYLIDPQFRYDSELEAYAYQLKWIKDNLGTQAADAAIFELSHNLSSLYRLNIPQEKAEMAIRRFTKKLL